MKNVLEVIKANKGVILKRGLIVVGAVAGLAIVGKVLTSKANESEELEFDEEIDEMATDEVTE